MFWLLFYTFINSGSYQKIQSVKICLSSSVTPKTWYYIPIQEATNSLLMTYNNYSISASRDFGTNATYGLATGWKPYCVVRTRVARIDARGENFSGKGVLSFRQTDAAGQPHNSNAGGVFLF